MRHHLRWQGLAAGQVRNQGLDLRAFQPSPRHPLPLCGINSTVFGKYLLDQYPELHGASSRALNARESTYVNPIGCVAPTRSASFRTEVNHVLARFALSS